MPLSKPRIILILFFCSIIYQAYGQLRYGDLIAPWLQYTYDRDPKIWAGGVYIPQLSYTRSFRNNSILSIKASAKFYGEIGFIPADSFPQTGSIDPYRAYADYSINRLQMRAGLQSIRFGQASLFRPLMWFDRSDIRDPLNISDGVWGLSIKYGLSNHINLWLWLLYGNDDPKGIEFFPTNQRVPEAGGRLQWVYPAANFGVAYHYRRADVHEYQTVYEYAPEHKVGIDARYNWFVGLYIEASSIHFADDTDLYTHQSMVTIGADYRFGFGLKVVFEQFISSMDEKAFSFENIAAFPGLSLSYPLSERDDLNYIFYYDAADNRTYNYLKWAHHFGHITLYCQAYWNPSSYDVNTLQSIASKHLSGRGIQVLMEWRH